MPTDILFKRKKIIEEEEDEEKEKEKERMRAAAASQTNVDEEKEKATAAAEQEKQKQLHRGLTQKAKEDKAAKEEKIRVERARQKAEIAIEKERVEYVDLDNQFEDKLPQKAINLGKYITKMKDKDINSDTKGVNALKKAHHNLAQVKNIATETLSFYLMVSDLMDPPKGVKMRRP